MIVFRVDASAGIGSGHFVRCLALAKALASRGCGVSFISNALPDFMAQELTAARVGLVSLPPQAGAGWEQDAKRTTEALRALGGVEWLIVDHYSLDARWQEHLREHCEALLVIDDLAARPQVCDVLVNQNLSGEGRAPYAGLVPASCTLLLGPRFALLRAQFASARRSLVRDPERAARILVFLGATDSRGVTLRALELIGRTAPQLSVDAIVGGLNPHGEEIRRRFGARPKVRLLGPTDDMAGLMTQADLALGAGGSSTWERCCLGLPSLVLALAENQLAPARTAAGNGACLYAGDASAVSDPALAAALVRLVEEPAMRRSMAESGMRLVDGQGCERVADVMLGERVRIRPAQSEDAKLVFPWRNADSVRRASMDPAPLTLEGHFAWFRRALDDPGRVLLIAEAREGPVGVLRYDMSGDTAIVSIYLDPAKQGRGYGSAMMRAGEGWLHRQWPQVRRIRAEVRPENHGSQRLFKAAGFAPVGMALEKTLR